MDSTYRYTPPCLIRLHPARAVRLVDRGCTRKSCLIKYYNESNALPMLSQNTVVFDHFWTRPVSFYKNPAWFDTAGLLRNGESLLSNLMTYFADPRRHKRIGLSSIKYGCKMPSQPPRHNWQGCMQPLLKSPFKHSLKWHLPSCI